MLWSEWYPNQPMRASFEMWMCLCLCQAVTLTCLSMCWSCVSGELTWRNYWQRRNGVLILSRGSVTFSQRRLYPRAFCLITSTDMFLLLITLFSHFLLCMFCLLCLGLHQEKLSKSSLRAAEDDLELLYKEDQRKMNSLDVMIPLHLNQVKSLTPNTSQIHAVVTHAGVKDNGAFWTI